MSPTTVMLHVRIEEDVKTRAEEAFSQAGLATSEAIRRFLVSYPNDPALRAAIQQASGGGSKPPVGALERYAGQVLQFRDLYMLYGANGGEAPDPAYHAYKYLYYQAFYQFSPFLDPAQITYVSRAAAERYEALRTQALQGEHGPLRYNNLQEVPWSHQRTFDPNRKVFHLEHIFTGTMFRRAVSTLRDAASVAALVRSHYRVAWILKDEDRRLPKTHRGDGLADALAVYADRGIELIPPGG